MNQLVLQRAKKVYELSGQLLIEDESDDIQGEAYRYAFLLLRGPKSFRHAFEEGVLYLEMDKIRDAFWGWRFDLPGVRGLTQEEMDLIDFHNEQVSRLPRQLYLKESY